MGPPAAANQSLKKFPLEVVGNQLYILAPVVSVVAVESSGEDRRVACERRNGEHGTAEQGGFA